MFISISTTGTAERPATDLGFLLHKHPGKVQRFATSHGEAHVFYPEATDAVCTAALLLEIDPVALVRRGIGKGRGGSPDFALAQYVNDRPYAASSLLAVALRTVFRTAMKGVCENRPGLADETRPLRIVLPAVPANGSGEGGGAAMVARLFEPLGWQVEAAPVPLDETFPEWGQSRYLRVGLSGTLRLADALQQLYVLLPVLDGAKHYWVAPDEVDKLLAAGEGWLADHPERALIAGRYLARRWSLTRRAMQRLELARLAEADDREAEEFDNAVDDSGETAYATGPAPGGPAESRPAGAGATSGSVPEPDAAAAAKPPSLAEQRRAAILDALREVGAARVADLGCGQGELIAALLKDARITEVLGVDVSSRALSTAARKLRLDRMSERQAARVSLVQGALTYTDARLKGYDAAVLSEVIEHLDLPRLPALEQAVLGVARPSAVVVTTPNAEYNVRWESLPAGHVRHADHRFEWDRAQFRAWAERAAAAHGYTVVIRPVGPHDPEVGAPTQLALFRLGTPAAAGTAPAPAGASATAATTAAVTTAAAITSPDATTPEGGDTR